MFNSRNLNLNPTLILTLPPATSVSPALVLSVRRTRATPHRRQSTSDKERGLRL